MTQNAIPLAGLTTRQRHALNAVLDAPGLRFDTEADENFIRFEAVFPSAHQLGLWRFALSLAGFSSDVDLRFILDGCDEESVAACVEGFRLAAGSVAA